MLRQALATATAATLLLSSRAPASAADSATFSIQDPVLNMDAFKIMMPAGWHGRGTLVQGTGCSAVPFPVFRVSSKDGLTTVERMPRFDWFWSDNPFAPQSQPGCLSLKRKVSADDFLKLLSAVMGVQYVRSVPVAPEQLAQVRAGIARNNQRPAGFGKIVQDATLAEADVKYRNGSFPMLGHLSGNVTCITTTLPPSARGQVYTMHSCAATVRYIHAPASTYAANQVLMSPKMTGAVVQEDWLSAYVQHTSQVAMQRSHDMFERDQAARQAEHEEFMATMQRGTDMSMRQAAAIANTDHTMASDWTDYALDRQTVRDPGSGQVSKVSSSYSHTWVDGSGHTSFQTNDSSANPNGTLPGVWTEQTRVHGDGS